MANLKNGTLNYFLTKDLDALENRENALKEMNKMDPTYPDPNDPRFTDPAPVFTILDNLLCRDGVSIGKVYNNKTGKVVEITETTETGFKYQDTEEDALINKDNSIAVVEKLTGLKGEVVSKLNNIIIYEASVKLVETTSDKTSGLHTNKFSGTNGVLTITSHEFENGVGTVTFDDDVTSIGTYAFYNCSNLTGVDIPNTVTSIGESAFNDCISLTSIIIPDSVTSIGSNAFGSCSGLTSVTIGNSVTSIDKYTFSGCTNLTSVTIPNSVTSIGNQAFYNCSGLTSVTIGSGVTSIGSKAFDTNANVLDNITCLATTAPSIYYDTFYVKSGGTLYVPIGSTGYNNWQSNTPQYLLGYWGWTLVEQ